MRTPVVLVVEDDERQPRPVRQLLEVPGVAVPGAGTAEQVVTLAKEDVIRVGGGAFDGPPGKPIGVRGFRARMRDFHAGASGA